MSNLPQGWVETTLTEVVSHLGDGLHGTPTYDIEGEYYFINGNNLRNGKIVFTKDTKRTSVEEFKKYKKDLNNRTLLVSINGTLGNVAEYNDEKCFLGKSACYFNVLDDVDKLFIKYTLTNRHFQKYIDRLAGGTTIKNVSLKTMREYPINLPPLPEQKAIADMLSSFDEKIELLREQNKTLETLAQTIFKEWFVHFNFPDPHGKPYRNNGGEMVESELGLIPKGWRVGKVSDLGKIVCGKTPSKSKREYFGGDVPFIKIPDMHNNMFIVETTDTLTQEGKASQALKTVSKGSISVSCIATVGLVSISIKESQTNQQINTIIPKAENLREFIFLDMQKRKKYLMDIGSGGTATLNVNTGTFSNIEVMIPSDNVLADFSATVSPIFEKILENDLQTQTLSKTRDILLPKLMSGQVRVSA